MNLPITKKDSNEIKLNAHFFNEIKKYLDEYSISEKNHTSYKQFGYLLTGLVLVLKKKFQLILSKNILFIYNLKLNLEKSINYSVIPFQSIKVQTESHLPVTKKKKRSTK